MSSGVVVVSVSSCPLFASVGALVISSVEEILSTNVSSFPTVTKVKEKELGTGEKYVAISKVNWSDFPEIPPSAIKVGGGTVPEVNGPL